jgi:phosphate:Na+ symporter
VIAPNFWEFLAGLGIFMFGMFLLEESIRNLSGRAFKVSIRKYTNTTPRAVLTGTIATAVLQSSSAVTLMVLAFTGAGIMALKNGLGVVFGSNLGTTFTSWLVAALGFKFSIEAFAMPFIGLGGLGLIVFGRTLRGGSVSKLAVGFGFLFMGIDYMRRGTEMLITAETLQLIPDYGPIVYVFAGFLLTAALQSSSASMAVVLSVMFGGLLSFQDAAAMVIGTNLGTTVTAMIGVVGGSTVKRRLGAGHVLFNVLSAIIALLLLEPLCVLISDQLGFSTDPVLGLALFHTIFNVLGLIVAVPTLPLFTRALERLVPERQVNTTQYISKTTPDVAEAALASVTQEVSSLLLAAMAYNERILGVVRDVASIEAPPARVKLPSIEAQYAELKHVQQEIYAFAAKIPAQEMTEDEALLLNRLLLSVRNAIASAKTLKDVRHDLDELESADNEYLNDRRKFFCKNAKACHDSLRAVLALSDKSRDVEALPRLIDLMKFVLDEDSELMSHTMKGLAAGHFSGEHVSVLLSTTRAFTLSARQILLAVKDAHLSARDAAVFENIDMHSLRRSIVD